MNEENDDLRCGYPTKSGGTCRNKVEKAGRPCRIHMKAALLDRILGRDTPAGDSALGSGSVRDEVRVGEDPASGERPVEDTGGEMERTGP